MTMKVNTNHILLCTILIPALYFTYYYNIIDYMRTRPFSYFKYPLDVDMEEIVKRVVNGEHVGVDPINNAKYPYIINVDRKCKNPDGEDEDVFLIFLIKSKLENFDQRRMIRKTWAREFQIPYIKICRVLSLGTKMGDRNMQHRIGLESQEYDDIVQQYFDDAYFNNTLKIMMGFQWAVNYCRTARYLAFVDDDYYINTNNVVKLLNTVKPTDVHDFIIGYIYENAMPMRFKSSKWYVSLEEYPYRLWPPYPTGGSFFLSFETLEKMQAAMPYTQYTRFDDVYIGIIAWKLKINLRHNKHLYYNEVCIHGIYWLIFVR